MKMNLKKWDPKSKQAKEAYKYFKESMDFYDRKLIRNWLNSGQIEILAVIYEFSYKKEIYEKIVPPLTFIDYYKLITKYFSLCFEKNHKDDYWIHSRYSAGRDLVGWFVNLWDDKHTSKKYLKSMKDWMANLYKKGDGELKECLITATLEHLFEDKKIIKYFSDWRKDPELKIAFQTAKEWCEIGESNPEKISILEEIFRKKAKNK